MPSFNQASFISQAIDSVMSQNYNNIELIIMDGGSTDGTIEILKSKSLIHQNINFTSGPDNGPANAFNKALSLCKGSIIGWLNSDDLYVPNIFETVVQFFESNNNKVFVYGNGEHIDENSRVIGQYPSLKPEVGICGFRKGCFICAPTVFFKRTVYTLTGPMDETLKTSFDYEYWLRIFHKFPGRVGFIDQVVAQLRIHENCITHRMRKTVALEGAQVSAKYLGRAEIHWLVTYLEEQFSSTPKLDLKSELEEFLEVSGPIFRTDDIDKLRINLTKLI
jgi:glycosyltransferase involved in cell wall biosynthesis